MAGACDLRLSPWRAVYVGARDAEAAREQKRRALEEEKAAVERAQKSEEEKKVLRARAVGPIQQVP